MVTFKKTKASRLNIKVNPQRRSLKAILLLFIEPCTAGPRKAKKYVNPDTTKVSVTVNRSPNRIYNNSIEAQDMWREITQLFQPEEVASRMDITRFYTDHKFGSIIDLRSMADTTMHGSGVRFVNTKDGPLPCDRKKALWFEKSEMPRFHNQRFSDEHYGQTVDACAVLTINGPKQHSV